MYFEFSKLVETIAMLRDPKKGCPWDLEQDYDTLLPYLIEESYEYIQAVKQKDFPEMENELGDVLLQVLLHAQIASETKVFDIESVSQKLNEKLIRRHPHVFQEPDPKITLTQLHINWEQIKQSEKKEPASKTETTFKEKDWAAPPLIAAHKIGKKTAKIDFDWNQVTDVIKKVHEELKELEDEIESKNKVNQKEELGDLLFSVTQLARHLDIDAHDALMQANAKFVSRFSAMEKEIAPLMIKNLEREEKEELWLKIKRNENS